MRQLYPYNDEDQLFRFVCDLEDKIPFGVNGTFTIWEGGARNLQKPSEGQSRRTRYLITQLAARNNGRLGFIFRMRPNHIFTFKPYPSSYVKFDLATENTSHAFPETDLAILTIICDPANYKGRMKRWR